MVFLLPTPRNPTDYCTNSLRVLRHHSNYMQTPRCAIREMEVFLHLRFGALGQHVRTDSIRNSGSVEWRCRWGRGRCLINIYEILPCEVHQ